MNNGTQSERGKKLNVWIRLIETKKEAIREITERIAKKEKNLSFLSRLKNLFSLSSIILFSSMSSKLPVKLIEIGYIKVSIRKELE